MWYQADSSTERGKPTPSSRSDFRDFIVNTIRLTSRQRKFQTKSSQKSLLQQRFVLRLCLNHGSNFPAHF